MVNDPEKLADFTMDKSLDDAIDEAKSQITFAKEGAVKQKEMVDDVQWKKFLLFSPLGILLGYIFHRLTLLYDSYTGNSLDKWTPSSNGRSR